MSQRISLGASIQINGELTGSEDLTIDGTFEGRILLEDHTLTIGERGRVKAEVRAKGVTIAGQLRGNIFAVDKVEVASTGTLHGDIAAPRVVLEDGARFRGSIDMEPKGAAAARATTAPPAPGVKGRDSRTTSADRRRTGAEVGASGA